jgi:hypothetical protein
VAHIDTVWEKVERKIVTQYDDEWYSDKTGAGIGADDRAGVYAVFDVLQQYPCSYLFADKEECGQLGAQDFVEDYIDKTEWNAIIEFDRRGSRDAVFYDSDNPDFKDVVCDGFYREAYGSASDISVIAPAFDTAAVNLSCGYYDEHTTYETLVLKDLDTSIFHAKKLIQRLMLYNLHYDYCELEIGDKWFEDEEEYWYYDSVNHIYRMKGEEENVYNNY